MVTSGTTPTKDAAVEQGVSTFARNAWKKLIRFAINVLGLLVLRGILGSLPMLKNATAFGDSLMSPLVFAYLIVDTVILFVVLDFGITLGRDIQARYQHVPDLGKLISLATVLIVLISAYRVYELPTACLVVQRTDLVSLAQNQSGTPSSFGDFMRAWSQMVGQVSGAAMQNATGDALAWYQQMALAVLRRPPNFYAWTFLVLIAIPVIAMVSLISRNLEAFTDLLSPAGLVLGRALHAPGTFARASAPAERASASGQGMSAAEMIEKLSRLKSLLDSGAISREDFEKQKTKISRRTVSYSHPADPEDFRKLKSLLDSGVLTEEEYDAHKQRLLEQL
jgi:hypothetical protein